MFEDTFEEETTMNALRYIFFVCICASIQLFSHSVYSKRSGTIRATVKMVALDTTDQPAASGRTVKEVKTPDNKTRAGKNGVNLAIQYFEPKGLVADDPLLVYIHGDSDDGVVNLTKNEENLLHWVKRMGDACRVATVFLQRPGFSSEIGKSDGFEGYDPSVYNKITVKHATYILGALESLHEAYPRRPIFIVGHSGGSMITLELMIYYKSQIVRGLVLSGCPMPKAPWGKRHEENRLGNPLDDYVDLPNDLPYLRLPEIWIQIHLPKGYACL
jgi:pimeloyl-ACP methyl ester carboxylesterase